MKFTAIFLLAAALQVSAKGHSQNVTISVKNESLEKVFESIKKQTGFSFLYKDAVIKKAGRVNINVKNVPLEKVLELCFKDLPLSYKIFANRTIVVAEKSESPNENTTVVTEPLPPPPIDISGKVINKDGEPLSAASITVKGKPNLGAKTDANGVFVLKGLSTDDVITISYAGYILQTHKVGTTTNFLVTMEISNNPLDEIQIIAYGTKSKRYQTGNVTTVKGEDIAKQPVSNPLLALVGRVPGLVITQSSGVAGSGVTVRVQGRNSINGGNDPLYIVDGVPYPSQMLATTTGGSVFGLAGILGTSGTSVLSRGGNGNPLSSIGVDNIESVEVLKDADATSIYGSRGANGVILITTKKGSTIGKTKFDFNFQQGWGKITRTIDMMNTEQYLEMRNEAMRNDGLIPSANPTDNGTAATGFRRYAPDIKLWESTRYTDWQKELLGGTAYYTDANASVSGGNVNTNYRIGGGYHRETTVFPGNFDNKRGAVKVSVNSQSQDQRFYLQFSANYTNNDNNLPQADFTSTALLLAPNAPSIHNPDGSLNWAPNSIGNSSWTNPLAQLYNKYENNTENLISSLNLGYRITSELEFKTQLGYNRLQTEEFAGISILSQMPERRASFSRSAQYTSSVIKFYLVEPQINYKRSFGMAKIDALLGSTIQKNQSEGVVINATGHPTDDLLSDVRSATSITVPSTIDAVYKYNALFGRINMNWANRYILNLTGRRDGSSRFGPENRFHNFGSVSGAWIFSEENILKRQSFLSFGKLRASYGTTGNDQIGDYTYLDLYNAISNAVPYQNWSSIGVDKIPNPYLQWEETRKLSLGLNLGFMKDRILVDASFNRNRSSNQLISYSLPVTTGFTSVYLNLPATVQNISWEFAFNSINIKQKNFSWETSFNLTLPQNKLVSFPGIEKTTLSNTYVIGQPLGITKAYRFVGVDPVSGLYQFFNKDGNITTSPTLNDRIVLIMTDPKWYGGFQNSFRLKGIEISTLFQFAKQTQSSAAFVNFGYLQNPGNSSNNQPAAILNRWQKLGDNASIQKYTTAAAASTSFSRASQSDVGYVDASFIRLKNIAASYDIKGRFLSKAKIEKLRLFIEGQNLLTITKFKGMDPENQSIGLIPPLRIFAMGINVGF